METTARIWLDLECRTIPKVVCGVVLLAESEASGAKPVATWPGEAPVPPELIAAARNALEHDRVIVNNRPGADSHGARSHVAAPIPHSSGAGVAVALELESSAPCDTSAAAGQLQSGAAWLEALATSEASAGRLRSVLYLTALCLEQERFRAAATAVATELATRLGCERVSIGLLRGRRMRIEALSHSAHFDERTQLVRDLSAAMEEATDQDTTVVHPLPPEAPLCIVSAHEQLAQLHGVWDVCTVPLTSGGRAVGALTLERSPGEGFPPETVRICEDLASMLGPALAIKRRGETGSLERGRERLRAGLSKLVRPGNPRIKAGAAALLACLVLAGFAKGEYRVKADATLEGRVQRAIVARVEGYIAEANARAGDVVQAGQTLGQLDERDLRVERRQSSARREQLRVEYFEALAAHDRTRANIASAQVAQAEAQIALLDEQLARTRLVAPFDGVVVKGDLSQSLGSPVAKGDVLFEVAPLNGYRIILRVDERDVSDVHEGRRGRLALSAMPGRSLPFAVERVTPVAAADGGHNYFRAEARLDHPPDSLRPGMEGVARIDIESRRLVWIWTHDLLDWLRLWLWAWWP
jgi:RND family efflux transporter MFP subunit